MPADPACQEHIAAGQAALCMGDPLVGPFIPIYAENRVDLKVRMNLTTYSLLYDEEVGFTEAYQELLTGMTAKMREEFDLAVTASALAVVLHTVETDPDNPDTAVLIDFSVVLPDVGTEESERFRDAFNNNFTHMMGNVIESFPMMLLSSSNQHGYPRTHAPTTRFSNCLRFIVNIDEALEVAESTIVNGMDFAGKCVIVDTTRSCDLTGDARRVNDARLKLASCNNREVLIRYRRLRAQNTDDAFFNTINPFINTRDENTLRGEITFAGYRVETCRAKNTIAPEPNYLVAHASSTPTIALHDEWYVNTVHCNDGCNIPTDFHLPSDERMLQSSHGINFLDNGGFSELDPRTAESYQNVLDNSCGHDYDEPCSFYSMQHVMGWVSDNRAGYNVIKKYDTVTTDVWRVQGYEGDMLLGMQGIDRIISQQTMFTIAITLLIGLAKIVVEHMPTQ
eukprot:gene1620-2263_t